MPSELLPVKKAKILKTLVIACDFPSPLQRKFFRRFLKLDLVDLPSQPGDFMEALMPPCNRVFQFYSSFSRRFTKIHSETKGIP